MRKTLALAVAALAMAAGGCNDKDREHLSRLGEKLGRRVRESLNASDRQLGTSLSGLATDPFAASIRAESRIRADKVIAPLGLEVEARGNTVVLRGRVPDAVYRQRAVELAESTVGVDKVVDELSTGTP